MINFKAFDSDDKKLYEKYRPENRICGCEYNFSNLVMWGNQHYAEVHSQLVLFSIFGGHKVYPFPLGEGDKKPALDAIIADAEERGIPCRLSGICQREKALLEKLYPNKFIFSKSRGSFDYVYDINDLADLSGRKYHSKRNHIQKFKNTFPDYTIEVITEATLPLIAKFFEAWYTDRLASEPDGDYAMEMVAIEKALSNYGKLGFEGLMLRNSDEILAVTIGSKMSEDTFDVHFEKALSTASGAYAVINQEFAKYLRSKYPSILYLDREEDMGIAGLRKAKLSYKPHHLVEKYRALYIEEGYDICSPTDAQIPKLRNLWKEAFGDGDEFLDMFFGTAFDSKRSRCISINGNTHAALYIFDCEYDQKPVAYIYAVATAKNMRGKGLSHQLMEDTHSYLRSLGYKAAVLVPAKEDLFEFYSDMGYQVCGYVDEFSCLKAENTTNIKQISKEEYSALRREFLPSGSVIQEGVNLDFLQKQVSFFTGDGFLLAARKEKDILRGIELLGDKNSAPLIVNTLGCDKGFFRTPGQDKPFAMYYPLDEEDFSSPSYFGLAFD